ncbi:MAG TPA: uroporphyrinogen-III synthase [Acidimicrobiales bacterium]
MSEVPLTATEYYDSQRVGEALAASAHFGDFRTLVVTSARSALYVKLARAALAAGAHVLSVGTATARALDDEDCASDVVGTAGAQDLGGDITEGPVLLLGAASMRSELANDLHSRGLDVEHLACYATVPTTLTSEAVATLRAADVVLIGAPSAWWAARDYLSEACWVVVPGATTAEVVSQDRERVLEGWGPQLASRLSRL